MPRTAWTPPGTRSRTSRRGPPAWTAKSPSRWCRTPANGLIDFSSRQIRIRLDVDDLMATKSLCHELGHALTMSPKDHETYATQRELREVEAESIALTLIWTRRSGWVRLEVVPTPLEVLVQ